MDASSTPAAASEAADVAARASEEAAHANATVEIAARELDEAKTKKAGKKTIVELESALHAALDRAESAELKAERAFKAVERLRKRLDLEDEEVAEETPAAEASEDSWSKLKSWWFDRRY